MKAKVIRKIVMNELQKEADMLSIERPDVHFYRDKAEQGIWVWGEVGPDDNYEICIVNVDSLKEKELVDLAYHTAKIMRGTWQRQTCDNDFFEAYVTTDRSETEEENEYPLDEVDAAAFGMLYTSTFYGNLPQEFGLYGTGFFDCIMQRVVDISSEFGDAEKRIRLGKEIDF